MTADRHRVQAAGLCAKAAALEEGGDFRPGCPGEGANAPHRPRAAGARDAFPGVYLVGARFEHHARHSGYEGFSRHVGQMLAPPTGARWPVRSWRMDDLLSAAFRKPHYSSAILATEVSAALHMLAHRNAIYHVIYADCDLRILSWLCRIMPRRVVATFHEPPPALAWMAVDERITRGLSGIILVANTQRPYFHGLFPDDRIFVIPHGVDTDYFAPPERRISSSLCISVGSKLRDFQALASAVGMVSKQHAGAKFLVVGADPSGESALGRAGAEHRRNLSDEELLAAYRRASVGVFALTDATANNAVLEAMAAGLPLVVTDVGGIREYVPAKGAIFCPPGDPESLSEATLALLRDKERADEMGKANRMHSLSFDYRAAAVGHRSVYEALLSRRPGSA